MGKKAKSFPQEHQFGSVIVRIHRVRNGVLLVKNRDGSSREVDRFSFMVSFHAQGKRHQKMFANYDKGLAYAQQKGGALSNVDLDTLQLSPADSRAFRNAFELLRPTGVPLEMAVQDYVEAWKVLGGRSSILEAAQEFKRRRMADLPDMPLPKAVDAMIEAKEKDKASDAYLKVLRVYLLPLKTVFTGQVRLITGSQVAEYLRGLEVAPRTRNNARNTIGAFFNFCKEREWLPRDHEGVSTVQKFKTDPTDITVFSSDELVELFHYARPEMKVFLAIGAFAGLRTAEIERLDWEEIHLGERFIELKAAKAKTASRRLVPITENLAKWLADHKKDHGRVWPFALTAKQIGWLVEDIDDANALATLQKAAVRAGLDLEDEELMAAHRGRVRRLKAAAKKAGKEYKPSAGRDQPTFLPDGTEIKYRRAEWKKNALRHSFISYRLAEIQNVAQVALEAGNSAPMIFQHYREIVRLKEAKRWFAIVPDKEGKALLLEPKVELKAVGKPAEKAA